MSRPANQSQSKSIYLKEERKWIEVPRKLYSEITKESDRRRQQLQYEPTTYIQPVKCTCPSNKTWLCDSDCEVCKFWQREEVLSLDEERSNEDGTSFTLHDLISNNEPDVSAIVEELEVLRELNKCLEELEPQARFICEMFGQGFTEREIAKSLGYENNSTINYQKNKAFKFIRKRLSKFFE